MVGPNENRLTANEEDVLEQAAGWLAGGEGCAIATVTETWGSSPRPVGSQLAVAGDGRFLGSVSGGCVEGAVVTLAKDVVESGTPQSIEFGVTDTEAWALGLACGGRVEIYIERAGGPTLSEAILSRLLDAYRVPRPVARVTNLESGAESLVEENGSVTGAVLSTETVEAARDAIAADKARVVADTRQFVRPHNPPARLIIVGATHIAQFLAPMARTAGYGVSIVDPRRAFATAERFPDTALMVDWPAEAFETLKPDNRTAVVTLAHDPKFDDVALKLALAGPAFYIGALGSRKNHAARLDRLEGEGLAPTELARIHGPIGLDIGALSPAEIAISILAEITRTRRLTPGR